MTLSPRAALRAGAILAALAALLALGVVAARAATAPRHLDPWRNCCKRSLAAAHGLRPPTRAIIKRVIDGDTYVTDKGRVRLVGVDTPETHGRGAPECFGEQASSFAARVLYPGRPVWLQRDKATPSRDRYRRLLRIVRLYRGDKPGRTFERLLLVHGLANVYTLRQDLAMVGSWLQWRNDAMNPVAGAWALCPGPNGNGPTTDIVHSWQTGAPTELTHIGTAARLARWQPAASRRHRVEHRLALRLLAFDHARFRAQGHADHVTASCTLKRHTLRRADCWLLAWDHAGMLAYWTHIREASILLDDEYPTLVSRRSHVNRGDANRLHLAGHITYPWLGSRGRAVFYRVGKIGVGQCMSMPDSSCLVTAAT